MSQIKGGSCEGGSERLGCPLPHYAPRPPCFSSHTPPDGLLISVSFSLNPFLSHYCICVFIYFIPTHTHFLSHVLLLLFRFVLSFFSPSLMLSTSAKSYKASDVEKSLVTIKKNKRMLHLPMSDRTLFRIFKVSTRKDCK